jgi:hypothetical protein
MDYIPTTVAGVGSGGVTRWIYSSYGNFLNIYGIRNHIAITFNTNSVEDIESKINYLECLASKGYCNPDDIEEVKERLKTLCDFSVGGTRPQPFAVHESSEKDLEVTVYRDGKPVKVKKRGKQQNPTEAQKKAAENARKYAHTDEANKKRRKSISARSDGKILGEI